MGRGVTVVPSATRLMESLRDMGYTLEAAAADLVDNSIDAGATRVDITICNQGTETWIRFADNGRGMTPRQLDEAMRYGSRRTYGEGELGRYGLGMKTASLAQCRCLTVATRTAPDRARIHIRCWDLDHVARTDAWEVLSVARHEADAAVAPLLEHAGTVVVWEQLDRVLAYRKPDARGAARGIAAIRDSLRAHLAMTFHRFIAGEAARAKPLEIRLDGVPVEAWDPYARGEPETRGLAPQSIPIETARGRRSVSVAPYVLAAQARFSSPAAHALAAGPRRWNRQQGLYIYVGDRLVQSGGWSRLRTEDEHTKLARIAIDVPVEALSMFGVDVAKNRIALPDAIRPELEAIITGVVARARDAYAGPTSRDQREQQAAPHSEGDQYLVVTDDLLDIETVATVIIEELEHEPALQRRILARLGLDLHDERPAGTVEIELASRDALRA
jgi:hypothetical protein